jgi:predicted DCC family thiol-disulfide oxidoreductase YuxK
MRDLDAPVPFPPAKPVLLFDDECGVCRHIARWVRRSAQTAAGEVTLVVRPIGDDPEALRLLNPHLDIWQAYATIHLLMPDGTMRLGGEAVAEVFRNLPNTRWFAGVFALSLFGLRPFQVLLNLGYATLAAVRPLFGCKSCGAVGGFMRPIAWIVKRRHSWGGGPPHPSGANKPHFSPHALTRTRDLDEPARASGPR